LGWGLYLLIPLHVAGALKHQLFDRNQPVLARMAPGARPGRWLDPRLLLILIAGAAVAAGAALVRLPIPVSAPPPAPVAGPQEAFAPPVPEAPAAPTPVAAEQAAPTAAEPVGWAVASGSALGFTTNWSGSPIEGRFDRWSADIVFAP